MVPRLAYGLAKGSVTESVRTWVVKVFYPRVRSSYFILIFKISNGYLGRVGWVFL